MDGPAGAHDAVTPPGLPSGLESLPWELPHTFLGLDEAALGLRGGAAAVILPVPYESTTSYGGGTREGPGAIVEASRYIELYDQELDCEAGADARHPHAAGAGAHPRRRHARPWTSCATAYAQVAEACGDRFLLMLGGEHSVSSPAILAQADRHAERLTVLQLDAHADLRPSTRARPTPTPAPWRACSIAPTWWPWASGP